VKWLAYLHPAAMVAVIALGLAAAREGLVIRRHRLRRTRHDRARHLRLARWFVALAGLGYLSGLASMVWLRDQAPWQSAHGALTSASLAALACAALLGLRLERRAAPPALRAVHLAAGALGLLLALAAAIAGFAILP
jgi:hypothetical protein